MAGPGSFVILVDEECDSDEEAAFLSALDAAENSRGRQTGGEQAAEGLLNKKRGRRQEEESVASSGGGPYACLDTGEVESSSSKQRTVAEGDYMAALRGGYSASCLPFDRTGGLRTGLPGPQAPFKSEFGAGVGVGSGGRAVSSGGGGCFKCGMDGHWAKDCTSVAPAPAGRAPPFPSMDGGGGGAAGGFGGGEDSPPDRHCPCGVGFCAVLTAKTAKNLGRKFYCCPRSKEEGQCGYFDWCDSVSSGGQSQSFTVDSGNSLKGLAPDLNCPCGAGPCKAFVAKTEKNMGRQFYRCPRGQGEDACGFFKWCDEVGLPNGIKSEEKSGPTRNLVSGNTGSCFKCGMDGHWSRDCPNSGPPSIPGMVQQMPISGGSPLPGSACYRCGQSGHWSKDCPSQISNPNGFGLPRGPDSARFASNYVEPSFTGGNSAYNNGSGFRNKVEGVRGKNCYKCGGQGHWANDCNGRSVSSKWSS